MTRSRKICITVGVVLLFFVILPAVAYLVGPTTCMPKEREYCLVFESQMSVDVTIVNQETLGTVPAGQAENLTLVMPNPKGRTADSVLGSLVDTIQLKAADGAMSVLWQKSWTRDEFHDLRKAEWRIVISPETNEE
jgi:hypothetical protein